MLEFYFVLLFGSVLVEETGSSEQNTHNRIITSVVIVLGFILCHLI